MLNTELPRSESTCEPIRVLLVDQMPRSPVRALLASIPLVQVCSPEAVAASPASQQPEFDVVIVDLPMAVNAPTAVEELHRAHPALPIIVLADRDHEDAALYLLRHGASDYLLAEHLDLDSATRALRYALSLSRLQRRVHDLNCHLELANHRLRELFLPSTEQASWQRARIANGELQSAKT